MERRTFMRMSPGLVPVLSLATVLVVGMVATSLPAEAQQAGKVPRLGVLASSSVVPTAADLQKRNAFLKGISSPASGSF